VENGAFSTTKLSKGQRKRLALLTVYLQDRPIYVFDEWAADQDPLFKEVFYRQILPELKGRGKGASPKDILRQFLIEGITLCLLGGFMGIVVGRGSSLLVGRLLGWPTQPSLLAALAAVTVSVTVGLTFGYYPALKAPRLDPIEALRYE